MDGLLDAQLQNALLASRSNSPERPGRAQTPDQIRAAAEDFEAVFLSQMMEQMMGPQLEQMRKMVAGNAFTLETVTNSIRVNPATSAVDCPAE